LARTNLRVWLLLELAVEVHVFVKKLFLLFGTAADSPRVHQVVQYTLCLFSVPLMNSVLLAVQSEEGGISESIPFEPSFWR
jgi:hypothetical protein